MIVPRKHLRAHALALVVAAALAIAGLGGARVATAQQLGEGMDRTGTVGIQNETERQLFGALICTCGCPREALSTCTCGFAHERRTELRAELAQGKSIEEIKAGYAARFGSQALAIPPNTGANRLLWIAPLVAIVFGAAFVGTILRRWRNRGGPGDGPSGAGGGGPRKPTSKASKKAGAKDKPAAKDKYDEMLDDELRELDDE